MKNIYLVLFFATITLTSYGQWQSNFGIGIEIPEHKLDVDGDINISSGHNFLIDGNPIKVDSNLWQTNENNIFFNTGNVGIGTDSPIVKLNISDSTSTDRTFLRLENKSLSSTSTVSIKLLAGQNGSFTSLSHLSESYAGSGNQADYGQLWSSGAGLLLRANGGILRFETSEEGASNERMRISTEGNVGINVTDPTEKLEVNGNILIKENNALILTSPNGTEFEITVDDNGNLTTSQITSKKTIDAKINLKIFPNPTENTLTVEINDNSVQIVDAEVYDLSGKMTFMKTYNSSSFTINTADFKTGNYILKLKTDEGRIIKAEKFIKQ